MLLTKGQGKTRIKLIVYVGGVGLIKDIEVRVAQGVFGIDLPG